VITVGFPRIEDSESGLPSRSLPEKSIGSVRSATEIVRTPPSPSTYCLPSVPRSPWREEQPLAVSTRAAAATVESTRLVTTYGFLASGALPAENGARLSRTGIRSPAGSE
jgi:hypothetical protein